MRRILSLLAAALVGATAIAQTADPTTLQGWAERLKKFGSTMCQEQVFIHTDNTCYFLGDTIHYKAYVRRSDGKPTNISKVLYAELFNQDGYLVERQQLELSKGQVFGSFVLPDTLYSGYYELRAYTRWQLNWGVTEHPHSRYSEECFISPHMAGEYYRDYEKLYSRVFPIFDKPQEPGDFVHDMTLRPMRRHFKAETDPLDATVQVFPEGGHLIAGVPNRVAFEANNEEQMHVEGTVAILDGAGRKVAEAPTEQRGRGLLEFTPEAGKAYTALLTWKDGTSRQKLPAVETDGVALRLTQTDGKLHLQLAASGTAAGEPLGLTVMNQGIVLDFRELGTGSSLTAELDGAALQTGVCQLTVFNAEGRIYADRLAFVRTDGFQHHAITFSGITTKPLEPFEQARFGVKGGVPGSTISLAVRDARHTEYIYDDGDILTEMLLSSQIRGFVEAPGYYFESDDDEHRRALDLLLMIQGWRRYDWHVMATPKAFTLNHMPEQATPVLMGDVNKYFAEGRETANTHIGEVAESNTSAPNDPSLQEEKAPGADSWRPALKETTGRDVGASANRESDMRSRHYKGKSLLAKEVLVHASFVKPGADQTVDGNMMTQKSTFSITTPRFYEGCYFHLAASDSSKWNKKEKTVGYAWKETGEGKHGLPNYPEFFVRLRHIYPRFVKPYTWYQCHLAPAPKRSALDVEWLNDGSRTLQEVTIGARRSGYSTHFDASKPAFVLNGYDAFNAVCDAGFCPGYYMGQARFVRDIARTFIGDMNLERDYQIETRLNGKSINTFSEHTAEKTQVGGAVAAMPTESFNLPDHFKEKFNFLSNISEVRVYTDYCPRREGDKHYEGANQPVVTVSLCTPPDEARYPVYRDRRYILPGFSAPEEFYQPDYSKKPLPSTKDYRRTLYWNPNLQLDTQGQAEVTFYNNSQQTPISVSAEGMADDGTLQSGRNMPEDR